MPEDRLPLQDSHRLRIGALTGGLRKLLDELHRAGVDPDLTAEVEGRIERLERETGARPPAPGNVVGAAVARMWVIAAELRAKSLRGYGALGPSESAFLDEHAESLEQSVRRLGRDIRRGETESAPRAPGAERT